MKNYHSALQQLRSIGLQIDTLHVDGKIHRCRATKGKERSGWYQLYEFRLDNGESLITGTFGEWHGAESNTQKIQLDKDGFVFTAEQNEAMRKRAAEDKKRLEAEQRKRAERCAQAAEHVWHKKTSHSGECDYLKRKGIAAHGVRFSEKSSLAIPVTDIKGKIHGLQIILDSQVSKELIEKLGRDKEFYPSGMAKKGHFHLIGSPINLLLVAEGYATAATLHEATGFPVAVAFDANNIEPVIAEFRRHYQGINIIICADNDSLATCAECKTHIDLSANPTFCHSCGKPHKKKNTGIERANLAAMQHNCAVVYPVFADEPARFLSYQKNQGKLTDFNDLMQVESLATVRVQIEQVISAKGWRIQSGARKNEGGGADDFPVLISTVNEFMSRFTLIEGRDSTFFDHKEHRMIKKNDVMDLCRSRDVFRLWQARNDRVVGKIEEFGFDASCTDPQIKYNIWNGMPTQPIQGDCEAIKDLLFTLCNDNLEHFQWVLKWLAYPLQHEGAKMKTTLVFHGGQGTGKNLFFEAYAAIYGKYAKVIDQGALEDKFNNWISGKLFLIADEVIARHDLFQLKNKLKAIITGDTIRINPKNLPDYFEKNQFNMVYLSNEVQPVALEQDDRRHMVIWIKNKQEEDFYRDVAKQIKNGGVEAFYHYLLHLDLGDFNEHTKPLETEDKRELIDINRNTTQRFFLRGWVAKLAKSKTSPRFQWMFISSIDRGAKKMASIAQTLRSLSPSWSRFVVFKKPLNATAKA